MIGARSQGSTLTSKAYIRTQDFATSVQVLASNWSISDNYTIYRRINGAVLGSNYLGGVWYNEVTASLGTRLNYDLEYYITIYDYNTNNVRFESNFFDNNTPIKIYLPSRNSDRGYSYEIRVRRKLDENGNRGYLVPSDMLDSALVFKGLNEYNYEEQTLPADWFATTTQTNVFIPLVTVTTPIETYVGSHGGGGGERGVVHDLNYYLEIPQEVAGVVSYIFYLFGQIASLKYVTTLICLAMVLGTLRFIMR